MLGVIHVTNAQVDPYRPQGTTTGWQVAMPDNAGNPLPGDPVRIRRGRAAAVPGRVYAVNYGTNTLFIELVEEEGTAA